MTDKLRGIILFIVVIVVGHILLFAIAFTTCIRSEKNRENYKNQTFETFEEVKFKGKILSIYKHNCGGHIYGIMQVKLDFSNVDSFYVYNDMNCFKISCGIATLPTNILHPTDTFDERSNAILKATYIDVHDNFVTYSDSLGNQLFTEDLDFPSNPLSKKLFDQISNQLD